MKCRPCPVCGSTEAKALHVRPHRRLLLSACGCVFVDPLPSAEESAAMEASVMRGELQGETAAMFDAYGRGYHAADPVVRGFERHLTRLDALANGRRLLDVGVGTGLFLHLARTHGFEVTGVELCPDVAAKAQREFDMPVHVGEFASAALPGGYDVITMGDVLEHSRDPRAFLVRARELLVPGGVLFVAVPNHRSLPFMTVDLLGRIPGGGGFADRLYVPYHLTYFTPTSLVRLVTEVGFDVLHREQESPHAGRYRMNPLVRLGLVSVLAASRLVGLEARLALFARRGP